MTVYKGYMKILKKNAGLLIMYLIIFFGITVMFEAFTGDNDYANYQAEKVNIAIVDEDGGTLARGLTQYLEGIHNVIMMENKPEVMQENLFYRNVSYIVRIPENFYESCMENGESLSVTKVPGSYTSFYVDQQINSYLNTVKTYLTADFTLEEAVNAGAERIHPQVTLKDESGNAGEMPAYAYYFRYIPYLFLSVLCYSMGYVLLASRKGDLPKRMQASAVSQRRQNLEGLLAMFTLGIGLWLIGAAGAAVMYGKEFLHCNGVGYYLINSLLMMAVSLSIAYLIGMFVKSGNMLNGITNVISLGMCFLCGVFVPMEVMSKGVLKMSQFLPVYWFEKVNDILTEYGTVTGNVKTQIWQALGIEAVFVIVFVCVILALAKSRRNL